MAIKKIEHSYRFTLRELQRLPQGQREKVLADARRQGEEMCSEDSKEFIEPLLVFRKYTEFEKVEEDTGGAPYIEVQVEHFYKVANELPEVPVLSLMGSQSTANTHMERAWALLHKHAETSTQG